MKKSDFRDFSSWRVDDCILKGGEVYTLDFLDTSPNMFLVQNPNDERILAGVSIIPTETNYEFDIPKNSTVPVGRPIRTNKLYLLNTGMVDIKVKIFSDYLPFDMGAFAGSNMNIEHAEISTDGIVKGFKSGVSLPSGDNNIGNVDVITLPENLALALADIYQKNNSIAELANAIVTYMSDAEHTGHIYAIRSGTSIIAQKIQVMYNMLDSLVNTINAIVKGTKAFNYKEVGFSELSELEKTGLAGTVDVDFATENFIPNKLLYITNDGKYKLTFALGKYNDSGTVDWGNPISLKKGEIINDILLKDVDCFRVSSAEKDKSTQSSLPISFRAVFGKY